MLGLFGHPYFIKYGPAAQSEKAHLKAARRKIFTPFNSIGDDATGPAEREKLTHARACHTVLSSIGIIGIIGIICIIGMLFVFPPLTRNVNLPKLPSASKEVASARHERLGVDESHARSKLSGMSDIEQLSASEDEALHNTLTVPSPPLLSPLPLPPPPPSPLPRPAKPPPPPSPLSPHLRWPKCNVLPIFKALSTGGGYEISQRQLILLAAPKAGATVTSRLAIALAGKTQAAMAYGGYPLRYAQRLPSNNMFSSFFFPGSFFSKCRQIESWTCIHFLRNPMDRAVSSYLHTMKHNLFKYTVGRLGVMCGAGGASVQHCLQNASFFEFISTLQDVAATKGASLDPHWTPQFHPDISYSGVTLVPIESLPDGYECPPLAKTEGQLLAGREGNFSTDHYVLHTDSKASTAAAFLDFTTLSKMRARGQVPPYDDFYKDMGFCRHILTCLYASDLDAYVKMCGQAHVRACPSLNAACQRELVRLRDVCGLPASKLGLNSSAH